MSVAASSTPDDMFRQVLFLLIGVALFFFLGCGPAPALHADNFTFDEAILAKGSAFWKALAAAF